MNNIFSNKHPSIIAIIIISCGYLAWMLSCSTFFDDWIYSHSSGETFDSFWNCEGGSISSLSDALNSCVNHYNHSNGRLADKLVIISNTVSPIISRLLHTVMFGLMLYLSLTLTAAGKYLKSIGISSLFITLVMIFLPWNDYFNASAINYNYLWSATINLFVIICFFDSNRCKNQLLICLLSFIAAMMHEGFTLPVLTGMIAWGLSNRKKISTRHIAIFLFYLVGAIILLVAPGTIKRINDVANSHPSIGWILHTLAVYTPAIWLFLSVSIYIIVKHGIKPLFKKYLNNIFHLFAVGMGIAIGIYSMMRGRAEWFPSLLLLILSFNLITNDKKDTVRQHYIPGICLTLLVTTWLLMIAFRQNAYSIEQHDIENRLKQQPSNLIYTDISNSYDTPWFMFDIPHPLYSNQPYSHKSMVTAIRQKKIDGGIAIIPSKYEGLHFSKWNHPKGNNSLYGEYPVFYSPDKLIECEFTVDISNAPTTLYNIFNKLSGENIITAVLPVYSIPIETSTLDKNILANFLQDVECDTYPDTLWFYQIAPTPRKWYRAEIIEINQ